MSIQEQKIKEAAIAANGVQSQPDKLTSTAAQNKKVFGGERALQRAS